MWSSFLYSMQGGESAKLPVTYRNLMDWLTGHLRRDQCEQCENSLIRDTLVLHNTLGPLLLVGVIMTNTEFSSVQ